jgi:dTMP kinase
MIIVLEGGDQAGKKTQTTLLANALKKLKIKTHVFSFPDYSTPIGKEIRGYLVGKTNLPPEVVHCLLSANRWEKFSEIQKAIQKNSVIIMNRYYHSNLVYGLVNKMNPRWLEKLDAGLPKADLVIVLDVSQKEAFRRKKTRRDQFEKGKDFQKKISNAYRMMAKKKRWNLVNASKPKNKVHQEIMKIFAKKLGL